MLMTKWLSLVRRLIGVGGATLALLGLTAVSATATDGRAVYDDTCVRCHGLLQEQMS
ncbi:MAG: hypothetical protein ACR2QJ_10280 [Geminicoccaceae bacterium]